MSEQLALEQRLRDRGAVLDEKRRVAPRPAPVDGARDQLLPRAGLALDQHRDGAPGRPIDEAQDGAYAGRGRDQRLLADAVAGQRRPVGAGGIDAGQHRAAERLADEDRELLDVARMLAQVVGGPELHGGDGELLRAGAGRDDDGDLPPRRAQRADDPIVRGVGQAEIRHHAPDRRIPERHQRTAQAVDGRHPHARLHSHQRLPHGRRVVRVVLDDENMQLWPVRVPFHHVDLPFSSGRGRGSPVGE